MLFDNKFISTLVTAAQEIADSPSKLGELDALFSSFTPKLLAITGSVQYRRVSLNFLRSCTLCVRMASSWDCKNCTFVASVRFGAGYSRLAHALLLPSIRLVAWYSGPAHSGTLSSLFSVSELSADSVFSPKISKSSVDVHLSSLPVKIISSVDVDVLLVSFKGWGVWLQSLSGDSCPLQRSSPCNTVLSSCVRLAPKSGSFGCSLWSESK